MSRTRPRRHRITRKRCRSAAGSSRRTRGPIFQLELLDDGRSTLIYATTARDGSGPLRSSFITMLMLEDTIANVLMPYVVCSGAATVTVHKLVSLAKATALGIFRQMMEFSQIASVLLAKRGIGLPGVISTDEPDVA